MRVAILLVLMVGLVCTGNAAEPGSPVTGQEQADFLRAWSERLSNMRTLHMVFKQEKHLPMLRQALVAQGELWLKGETLLYTLRHATTGATELVVRLDTQTVQTYYPLLHTLEVLELRTAGVFPQALPFWQPQPEALARDYEVALWRDATGLHTLRLVPREASAPLAEIRLLLRDLQPQAFVQVEKNGTRITMHMLSFATNTEISEAQLELRVPTGTKVVHPLQ